MRVMHLDLGQDGTFSPAYMSSRGSSPTSPLEELLSSSLQFSNVQATFGRPVETQASGPLHPHALYMQSDSFIPHNGRPTPAAYSQVQGAEAYMLAQAQIQRAMMLQLLAAQDVTQPNLSGGPLDLKPTLHTFPVNEGSRSARALLRKEGLGRIRVEQACEKCRKRKVKCSGERPSCTRCNSRGITCHYAPGKEPGSTRSLRGTERTHTQFATTSSQAQLSALLQATQVSLLNPLAAQILSQSGVGLPQPTTMYTSEAGQQPAHTLDFRTHGRTLLNMLNPTSLPSIAPQNMRAPNMHFPGGPNDNVPQGSLTLETFPFPTSDDEFLPYMGSSRSTSPSSSVPSSAASSPPVWSSEPPALSRSSSCAMSRLSSSSGSDCSSIGDHQGVGLEETIEGDDLDLTWMETQHSRLEDSECSLLETDLNSQTTSEFEDSFGFDALLSPSGASDLSIASSSATSPPSSSPSSMNSSFSDLNDYASEFEAESSVASDIDALMASFVNQDHEEGSSQPVSPSDTPSEEPYICDALRAFLGDIPPPVIASSGTLHHLAFTGRLPLSYYSSNARRSNDDPASPTESDASSTDPLSPSDAALDADFQSAEIIVGSDSSASPILCSRTSSANSEAPPSTPTDEFVPTICQMDAGQKAPHSVLDTLKEVSDIMEHVTNEVDI